jgi:amino acid transporter
MKQGNASRRSFFAGTQLPQDAILMTDATVPIDIVSVPAPAPTLRRELGRWNLTAIGVNQVIGSAVFILPSQVAAQLGNWSPIAFLLAGFASLLVALCFAEVGSRFDGTGGAYLYARAAFGRFVGFEVGWLQWISGATLQAAVANAIALALGFYWPVMTGGVGRASIITAVTLTVAWINVRGIRQSAIVINLFTIAKPPRLGCVVKPTRHLRNSRSVLKVIS